MDGEVGGHVITMAPAHQAQYYHPSPPWLERPSWHAGVSDGTCSDAPMACKLGCITSEGGLHARPWARRRHQPHFTCLSVFVRLGKIVMRCKPTHLKRPALGDMCRAASGIVVIGPRCRADQMLSLLPRPQSASKACPRKHRPSWTCSRPRHASSPQQPGAAERRSWICNYAHETRPLPRRGLLRLRCGFFCGRLRLGLDCL